MIIVSTPQKIPLEGYQLFDYLLRYFEKGEEINWEGIKDRIYKGDLPSHGYISLRAHLANLDLNLVMRGSHTSWLEGLAPIGTPK